MKTPRFGLLATVLAAIPAAVLMMAPKQASAVPAWSRATGMPCTSCHFGGTNRLTSVGKSFQWRGYRLASTENSEEATEINLGNYMSFSSKVRFNYDSDASPKSKFDVEALSIYSGGPLYENFSYFFEYYLHERGKESNSTGTGTTDTAVREKLAEAYVFYNSAPENDSFWFARAGQWTPRIIHAASTGARVSLSRPAILNDVDGSGNLFTPRDRFYGLAGGWVSKDGVRGEFGVTNGGGGNSRANQPENNDRKDIFGSVEKVLDDSGSYVGLFGYSGGYPYTVSSVVFEDQFTRFGVVGAFERENFEISGGYFTGRNKVATGGNRSPKGYYLEGATSISDKATAYARYDFTDFDLGKTKRATALGVSFRMSSVGRFVAEMVNSKVTGSKSKNAFTFELNWLF